MTDQWVNTKSEFKSILRDNNVKPATGLDKLIKSGCSQYEPDMNHVQISLLEHFITSEEELKAARNGGRVGCQWSQSSNLKKLEDKWICTMGTYHGKFWPNVLCVIKVSELRYNSENGVFSHKRISVFSCSNVFIGQKDQDGYYSDKCHFFNVGA